MEQKEGGAEGLGFIKGMAHAQRKNGTYHIWLSVNDWLFTWRGLGENLVLECGWFSGHLHKGLTQMMTERLKVPATL